MQRCEMVRLADVQDLDLDPTFILVREILEHRSAAAASDRADDVPSFLQEFRGHGVAETARGADEKDCLGADRVFARRSAKLGSRCLGPSAYLPARRWLPIGKGVIRG